MKAVAVAESYSPGAVASESFMLLDGEPTGALAFFTGRKPVDKALLDKAYDGVDAFSIHSTEPKLLYDAIYNSVVAVHDTAGDKMDARMPILQMLADYEKRHNIKIGDDFFGSVGPDCYSYSYPPKAGAGSPSPTRSSRCVCAIARSSRSASRNSWHRPRRPRM